MMVTFEKLTAAEAFFEILPLDWQDIIVPLWPFYRDTSEIYVLKFENLVIGGGIVFSKTPPNATDLELSYNNLFVLNYHYLGFIFITPLYRNKNLASYWLSELKKRYSDRKFWLTIEDYGLKSFYEKNGFKQLDNPNFELAEEWIFVYEPETLS